MRCYFKASMAAVVTLHDDIAMYTYGANDATNHAAPMMTSMRVYGLSRRIFCPFSSFIFALPMNHESRKNPGGKRGGGGEGGGQRRLGRGEEEEEKEEEKEEEEEEEE